MSYVIGIDEVGRGPIAGPVVVCACAVRKGVDVLLLFPKGELRDSKKLSEKQRLHIVDLLNPLVESGDVVFGLGEVGAEEIDSLGITHAIKKAMQQALNKLHEHDVPKSSFVFLDGALSLEGYDHEVVIKGDEKIPEIALASIIAKTYRDAFMKKISDAYEGYGFDKHVGYGTKAHYEAIQEHGLTPLHRRSFLKKMLEEQ
jgi:ribonuclease HII